MGAISDFVLPDLVCPLLARCRQPASKKIRTASVGALANAWSLCRRAPSGLPARRHRSLTTASHRYELESQLGGAEVLKQLKRLIGPFPLGDRYGLVHDVQG